MGLLSAKIQSLLVNATADAVRAVFETFDTLALYSSSTPPEATNHATGPSAAAFAGYAPKTVAPNVSGVIAADGTFTLTLAGPFMWVPTGGVGGGAQVRSWGLIEAGGAEPQIFAKLPVEFNLINEFTAFRLQDIAVSINLYTKQVSGTYKYTGIQP